MDMVKAANNTVEPRPALDCSMARGLHFDVTYSQPVRPIVRKQKIFTQSRRDAKMDEKAKQLLTYLKLKDRGLDMSSISRQT